jgi:hypothetical protein
MAAGAAWGADATGPWLRIDSEQKDQETCRRWNELEFEWRMGWLHGYSRGLYVGAADVLTIWKPEVPVAVTKTHTPGLTYGEWMDGITEICKRPENALISLSDASTAFTRRVSGDTEQQVENFLSGARAAASGNFKATKGAK